jgi:hypothetical protein
MAYGVWFEPYAISYQPYAISLASFSSLINLTSRGRGLYIRG